MSDPFDEEYEDEEYEDEDYGEPDYERIAEDRAEARGGYREPNPGFLPTSYYQQ